MRFRILFFAIGLSGCATISAPPVLVETYPIPYDKLAACFYMHAREESGTGIRYDDLRANRTVLVSAHSGEVAIWEAWFKSVETNTSRVEIKALPTIWGKDLHAQRLMPHIRACL